MLRKQEKNAVIRGFLLAIGWGWGLDRFYEGDKKGGILSIIGWGIIFASSISLLKCSGVEEGVKYASKISVDPLIVLPVIAGSSLKDLPQIILYLSPGYQSYFLIQRS